MIDFDTWLKDLSTQPIPGGVSAAAVAAAMGAALVAKAVRVTLERRPNPERDRLFLQEALDLAAKQERILLDLSSADTEAFRAVLDLRDQEPEPAAVRQAWWDATNVPVCVAEACQALLAHMPRLVEICWPAVCPDLKTGGWLLEAGKQAGLYAAEVNLDKLGEASQASLLQGRIRDLDDGRDD